MILDIWVQFENDETLTDEIIYNNVEAVQHAWLINKKRYSFFLSIWGKCAYN